MPAEKWESRSRCLFPAFSEACLAAILTPAPACVLDNPACFMLLCPVLHGFHICSTEGVRQKAVKKWKTGTECDADTQKISCSMSLSVCSGACSNPCQTGVAAQFCLQS